MKENADILDPIIGALGNYCPNKLHPRLMKFLKPNFEEGKALLLLDGLDEMPELLVNAITNYLGLLVQTYAGLRVIVTASNRYHDGLTRLGLLPTEIALWDKQDQNNYLSKWKYAWLQVNQTVSSLQNDVDKTLLQDWLLINKYPVTPMELTLKTWAAYAGDTLGPSMDNAIEAYIKRITAGSLEAEQALEKLALQTIFLENPILDPKEVDRWKFPLNKFLFSTADETKPEFISNNEQNESLDQIKIHKFIPILTEKKFLWSPSEYRLSFIHQIFAAYLAGKELSKLNTGIQIIEPSKIYGTGFWDMKIRTLNFYASHTGDMETIQQILDQNKEPLNLELLTIASFLKDVNENYEWRSSVLRKLVIILQSNKYPLPLQVKTLTALVLSNDPGVKVILKEMVRSNQTTLRILGALGYGLVGEIDPINELTNLLGDPIPSVVRAACLALVSIGNRQSIEAITSLLLHGQEGLQRAAAESLANLPEEGFRILNEASHMEDLLIRRAVIFGLQRLRNSQSIQLLEKIQIEESQWVVKDATTEAIGILKNTNPFIPHPVPPPYNCSWLIKFAGERGQGLSPLEDSTEMLLLAAKEGSEEQKISALETLQVSADSSILSRIHEIYNTSKGDLKSAAFSALWNLAMAGYY